MTGIPRPSVHRLTSASCWTRQARRTNPRTGFCSVSVSFRQCWDLRDLVTSDKPVWDGFVQEGSGRHLHVITRHCVPANTGPNPMARRVHLSTLPARPNLRPPPELSTRMASCGSYCRLEPSGQVSACQRAILVHATRSSNATQTARELGRPTQPGAARYCEASLRRLGT